MKDSLCAICGGKVVDRNEMIDRIVDGRLYLFENVSVEVCEQCNETWVPAKEAERMDKAIHGKIEPKKQNQVPVY